MLVQMLMISHPASSDTSGSQAREYRIKAAFLHKFLQFIGPAKDLAHDDDAVLGILGKDPFGASFDAVEGEPVGAAGRTLVVRRLSADASAAELRACALLFVSRSMKGRIPEILDKLRGYPVVTVSETDGFVEAGGILNLVVRDKKIRWEVNYDAVEEAGLRLSSQILRNAVRVIRRTGGY